MSVSPVPFTALVLTADPSAGRVLERLLGSDGFECTRCEVGDDLCEDPECLCERVHDLVLVDLDELDLSTQEGLDVLTAIMDRQRGAQFLFLTSHDDVRSLVSAMGGDMIQALEKPLGSEQLREALDGLFEGTRPLASPAPAGGPGRPPRHPAERRIVGRSPPMERMFEAIEQVADTGVTVLIQGETGTGKELVAQTIHEMSPRSRARFVPVVCSALPEHLLESELFGHTKGAFTGAVADRRGLVEQADGGTLFLDEVSTITPATQVKLLRVLQSKTIQRVGGEERRSVDFRLLAASNVDLAAEVEAGRFREDLYYRLDVFPVRVPPLRERLDDLPLLVEHFVGRAASDLGVPEPEVPAEVLDRMQRYPWPGNVRELENVCERGVVRARTTGVFAFEARELTAHHDFHDLLNWAHHEGWSVDRLQEEYIRHVLEATDGNRTRAAELLGLNRRTVARKAAEWSEPSVEFGETDLPA